MKLKKEISKGERLYKTFVYVVLAILAVLILIPVLWVMVASVKETTEHYGSPWALPSHIHWQNFVDAWTKANMGGYMLHSVTITALALGILLVVALPASYCLARFKFVSQKFLNTCFMAGLFINVNYIVVPIYLMLSDGDKWLKGILGNGFLLNNHLVVAVVYAATALPFTIYLLSWPAQAVVEVVLNKVLHLPALFVMICMFASGVIVPMICVKILTAIDRKIPIGWIKTVVGM